MIRSTIAASKFFIPLNLLIGLFAVSFSAIFIEWSTAPSGVIGMYRLWISAFVLLPLALYRWREVVALSIRELLLVTLAGVFLGLHFLFWIQSLKETSVASSMIIISLEPIFVIIGSYFLFNQKIYRRGILCMLVATLGCAVVASADLGRSSGHLVGDLLSFIGTIAVSVYMLAGQTVRKTMSIHVYNVLVFFIAGFVLFLCNLFMHVEMTHYNPQNWLMFALLAFVSTILGHGIFNGLLDRVSATTVAMVILCEPIGAIILAFLLLHQPIHILQAIGGALCLVGVYGFLRVNQFKSKKRNDKQNPPGEETNATNRRNSPEYLDAGCAQEI